MHESINNNISSCETINIISNIIINEARFNQKKIIMNETINIINKVMN